MALGAKPWYLGGPRVRLGARTVTWADATSHILEIQRRFRLVTMEPRLPRELRKPGLHIQNSNGNGTHRLIDLLQNCQRPIRRTDLVVNQLQKMLVVNQLP